MLRAQSDSAIQQVRNDEIRKAIPTVYGGGSLDRPAPPPPAPRPPPAPTALWPMPAPVPVASMLPPLMHSSIEVSSRSAQ